MRFDRGEHTLPRFNGGGAKEDRSGVRSLRCAAACVEFAVYFFTGEDSELWREFPSLSV